MTATDTRAELVLEHLRFLRDGQKEIGDALIRRDGNFRALEGRLNTMGKDIQHVYRILANHGGEFDYIRQWLNRIEDRLDIAEDISGH